MCQVLPEAYRVLWSPILSSLKVTKLSQFTICLGQSLSRLVPSGWLCSNLSAHLSHWELSWTWPKRNQGAKWLNSLPICSEWRPPLVWTWAAWNTRRGVVDSNLGSKILRFEQVPLGFGFLLCKVMGLAWGSFHLKNSTIYHTHRKWWLLNRGDWHFCLPAIPTLVLAENAYFQDPETPSNSLCI